MNAISAMRSTSPGWIVIGPTRSQMRVPLPLTSSARNSVESTARIASPSHSVRKRRIHDSNGGKPTSAMNSAQPNVIQSTCTFNLVGCTRAITARPIAHSIHTGDSSSGSHMRRIARISNGVTSGSSAASSTARSRSFGGAVRVVSTTDIGAATRTRAGSSHSITV